MAKNQQHPAVADAHAHRLALADAPAVQHQPQQQHQCRVEVQDQPFKRSADVLQTGKVEEAGQVVAGDAQPDNAKPVMPCQANRRHTVAGPASPPNNDQEKRQGEQHAQHDERDRIHSVAVCQLDDDRFGAESDGA